MSSLLNVHHSTLSPLRPIYITSIAQEVLPNGIIMSRMSYMMIFLNLVQITICFCLLFCGFSACANYDQKLKCLRVQMLFPPLLPPPTSEKRKDNMKWEHKVFSISKSLHLRNQVIFVLYRKAEHKLLFNVWNPDNKIAAKLRFTNIKFYISHG